MEEEDDFKEVYSCGIDHSELSRLLQLKSSNVKDLLSRGSCTEALIKALEPPIPLGVDEVSLKELNRGIVLDALSAFKSCEISSSLQSLTSAQIDLLFKYVYKGFEFSFDQSSSLLLWHEKLLQVAGVGGIVRVLTDMKTI